MAGKHGIADSSLGVRQQQTQRRRRDGDHLAKPGNNMPRRTIEHTPMQVSSDRQTGEDGVETIQRLALT